MGVMWQLLGFGLPSRVLGRSLSCRFSYHAVSSQLLFGAEFNMRRGKHAILKPEGVWVQDCPVRMRSSALKKGLGLNWLGV